MNELKNEYNTNEINLEESVIIQIRLAIDQLVKDGKEIDPLLLAKN